MNNNLNVIFVTGYSQYTLDAFELYASDYILKPVTSKKIQKSLDNLRKPVIEKSHIRVQTFGNFDVFVNNVSVSFKRKKAKECLAYLVDKHGSGATKKEIAAVVLDMDLYDERGQDLTSKILLELERALKAVNAKQMLVKKHNYYAVDISTFDCDLYDYEKGDVKAINSFHGEYMSQYSWAEYSLIFLNNQPYNLLAYTPNETINVDAVKLLAKYLVNNNIKSAFSLNISLFFVLEFLYV